MFYFLIQIIIFFFFFWHFSLDLFVCLFRIYLFMQTFIY